MRLFSIVSVATVTLLLAAPRAASAQTFFTPFVGATFGQDAPTSKLTEGASFTFMGKVAGFEGEFGYTPDFFNQQSETAIISSSNVTTVMGNLLVGVGAGPVRPYGVAGFGLVRTRVGGPQDLFTNVTTNDFGVDIGGGVIAMVSRTIGFRGDLRYMRSLENPSSTPGFDVTLGKFDYWRGTGGVTFRF